MKRRTLDHLLSSMGALVTVILAVAAGLAFWGASFTNSQVHSQLAAQKIYFPPATAFAHAKVGTEITPSMIPSVSQYAGQELTTGAQAEVYANDFIAVHLKEIGGGQTYSQLSAKAMADPNNQQLAGQVATMFKGTTLRGLLLEAYAFSIFGTIATIAAWSLLVAALVMLVLTLMGFAHARRAADVV